MRHDAMIVALIEHFIASEGTDYLDQKGTTDKFPGLTSEECVEITRLRDIARTNVGWHGY